MIKLLDAENTARWDDFVKSAPDATFFHQAGWKEVIERSFGHKTYFMYAETNGSITGILPLVHVKSALFGNALSSTAFCVYGGIVANDAQSDSELDQEACRLANSLGVDHLELRNQSRKAPERPYKELYFTFKKELAPNIGDTAAIPYNQRSIVRKAIKAGLTSVIDQSIDRFYQVLSESYRNLGTPIFTKNYFRILKEVFAEQCEVVTIEQNGQLISSVMNFYFRDEVLPYYGGGTELARKYNGDSFMYWEVMRRAVEKGVKLFDFGRSKAGTGSYRFKENWGFTPEPLYYEFYLVNAQGLPDINPLNPKYRLFIAAWKRLPLGISQLIGPVLSKYLG